MFDRFKHAVVESFVGAVALGFILGDVILEFVEVFASPVSSWVSRTQYRALTPHTATVPGFSLRDALPHAVRFFLLLLVWFVLLRWLYFKPLKKETSESVPNSELAGRLQE
jgi:nitric oxide reductase large subunit